MHRATLLALALLLALAAPAIAEECKITTSRAEITVPGTPGVHDDIYLVDWLCSITGFCFVPWIYEEANGMPGLQRQDEIVDDTCNGRIQGDRIIF